MRGGGIILYKSRRLWKFIVSDAVALEDDLFLVVVRFFGSAGSFLQHLADHEVVYIGVGPVAQVACNRRQERYIEQAFLYVVVNSAV